MDMLRSFDVDKLSTRVSDIRLTSNCPINLKPYITYQKTSKKLGTTIRKSYTDMAEENHRA